ncbi:baseplate J/gp47 family protein [Photobacterium damselae subsp. damselae]|uniref:baseplate J/gp47 family protein n=1 Tax=Photobacterium damselae TaxID=38293 RepID=UPI00311ACE34
MSRFPNIPEPKLVDIDYDADLASLKTRYQDGTGHYPGINDPETFHLEQIAYEKNELKLLINDESKQNLLPFARDERLDNIGALVDCTRLDESNALTVLQFSLNTHSSFVIPKGYQVMAIDGATAFETIDDVVVDASATSAQTVAQCTIAGVDGNGFAPGQINQPIVTMPEIASVTNTTTSQGGAPVEGDDAYAERIFLAPSSFSVCGPYDAYKYFALSANPAIKDVAVINPAPNEIELCAILSDGSLPDKAIKDQILAACNGKKRVPMGDLVSMIDAESVTATATFSLEIFKDYASFADSIKTTAQQRIQERINKWAVTFGQDIVPDALASLAQSIEGVSLARKTITDSAGAIITDRKSIGASQRPEITITSFDFIVIAETSEGGI